MNIEEQLKQILKIPFIEERYLELIKLLNKDRDRLIKQNKRYKQALEFYADSENWIPQNDDVLSEITMDYGSKAQQALGWGEENDKHRA